MFYSSTFSWLEFQQETKLLNINFKGTGVTSAQKSHLFLDDFEKTFVFSLKITYFSFIYLTGKFLLCTKKLKFKLLLPGTVSFLTSYQRWLIRQRLLISGSSLPLLLSVLDMQSQQTAIFKSRYFRDISA